MDSDDAAYVEAEKLGLSGFDVDMDLTAAQNLDMAKVGFTSSEVSPNEWEV